MRSVDDMELCPGSGNKPNRRSVCPVCEYLFKHTTFTKVTPTHRRWKQEIVEEPTVIKLAGRVFRRHGESWLMEPTVGRYPVVFDGTDSTTFEFRVIAQALDEIERLTPENVEEPT